MTLFSDGASRVDDPYLSRALSLAERARGATSPNPLVGCVVVRDGRIVGEGFHPCAGEPHAEVFALRDAGEQARGADVYVTLEPCAHHGKTPPCAEALVAAGVARVVVGMRDPNVEAAGGSELLRRAGIGVAFAADPGPFAELNEGWLKRVATGMPFVRAKIALSLDGRPAFAPGRPAAITGVSGARVTRMLRERSDAVAVGASTALADDPALTVRSADGVLAARQPLRVVLARQTQLPQESRLLSDGLAQTLVVDASSGLGEAFGQLGRMGLSEVLVEPGPRLLSALWEERLLDELVVVSAGGMGGATAPAAYVGAQDCEDETLVHRMRAVEAGIVGDVSVTVWRPQDDAREP